MEGSVINPSENLTILIKADNSKFLEKKTIKLLKKMINHHKFLCIYITSNKPARILKKLFKSENIDINKLIFIDTITRLSEDVDLEKNLIYIDSPKKLTELQIILRNSLELYSDVKKKFIFVDSLSNIRNYNSGEETIKFVQSTANKLRLIEIGGDFLITKGGLVDEKEVQECSKCVDKTIEW